MMYLGVILCPIRDHFSQVVVEVMVASRVSLKKSQHLSECSAERWSWSPVYRFENVSDPATRFQFDPLPLVPKIRFHCLLPGRS